MAMEEPKKPQNAYWMFLSDNREALTKEAGSAKAPIVGKFAGEKWKAMTAEQKATFEKRAAEAKKEYEQAMEAFKAQGGVAGKRRAEKAEAKKEAAGKKAKKDAQDPNKPKRPQTAYWLWLAENRDMLSKETGSKDVTQVAKLGGERWKALPAESKTSYEAKAAELKKQHDKDMEEWKTKTSVAESVEEQ